MSIGAGQDGAARGTNREPVEWSGEEAPHGGGGRQLRFALGELEADLALALKDEVRAEWLAGA